MSSDSQKQNGFYAVYVKIRFIKTLLISCLSCNTVLYWIFFVREKSIFLLANTRYFFFKNTTLKLFTVNFWVNKSTFSNDLQKNGVKISTIRWSFSPKFFSKPSLFLKRFQLIGPYSTIIFNCLSAFRRYIQHHFSSHLTMRFAHSLSVNGLKFLISSFLLISSSSVYIGLDRS